MPRPQASSSANPLAPARGGPGWEVTRARGVSPLLRSIGDRAAPHSLAGSAAASRVTAGWSPRTRDARARASARRERPCPPCPGSPLPRAARRPPRPRTHQGGAGSAAILRTGHPLVWKPHWDAEGKARGSGPRVRAQGAARVPASWGGSQPPYKIFCPLTAYMVNSNCPILQERKVEIKIPDSQVNVLPKPRITSPFCIVTYLASPPEYKP